MRSEILKKFILVQFLGLLWASSASTNLQAQIFSQGFDLLNVSTDARSLALGDATTALNHGASAWLANPANALFSNASSVQATYHQWIQDITYQHASALFKNDGRAVGFSVYSNAISDIEVRNRPGAPSGNFSVNYLVLTAGIAQKIMGINAGLSASLMNEQYLTQNARGYSINAGLSKDLLGDDKLIVAMAVNHLGKMQRLNALRTELPSSFKIGLRSELVRIKLQSGDGKDLPITVMTTLDWLAPLDTNPNNEIDRQTTIETQDAHINLGLETRIGSYIAVRGGYKSWNAARNWSYGLGINLDEVKVDLTQVPFSNGFGNAWTVTLRYFFN